MPTSAPPTARARELVLDGRRVRYWCHGPDDDALPPLLLVHGFRGDHHGLELLARRLGPRRRVVVPDLPGFGRSEPLPRRPHDVPAYTAFLHRFLAALPGAGRRPRCSGTPSGPCSPPTWPPSTPRTWSGSCWSTPSASPPWRAPGRC
ncbi:hypothetical protein AUQ48_11270 [Kocuria flava]|uniref:AB hydrolase-1 domain-containing protein n=1 Tax=Kocuria flava TaxID=446860 RepID=A0A2N4T3B2_9MICC|nr:hypothetical protein AUQ48_11270 [Kocuria flava]